MLSTISYSINGIKVVNPNKIPPGTAFNKNLNVSLGFFTLAKKYQIESVK
jgi:hypothetical protein